MSREWEGMPEVDYFEEFYSICEKCGRCGHDGRGPQYKGDAECEVCLPVRERVAWREIEWILYNAMVKLGRLPDPWARPPETWAAEDRRRLAAQKRAAGIRERIAPLVSRAKRA